MKNLMLLVEFRTLLSADAALFGASILLKSLALECGLADAERAREAVISRLKAIQGPAYTAMVPLIEGRPISGAVMSAHKRNGSQAKQKNRRPKKR